ncbi:MAG: 50S ribosomal protein L30 [Candidatus Zixiibacteriota bacterium]
MSKLKITQIRSTIEKPERQKRIIQALGLGKIRRTVVHKKNAQIEGMVNAVRHLVSVEEIK